ncbi:hypothetical protein PAMA_008237 [Pampus argenteus]
MLSSPPTTSSAPPPSHHTVTSDARHVTMETYWSEVQSIEEEKEGEEEEEEEERKSMDEVELEEAWLTEAGLSSLVTSEEAPPLAEALLSTLTLQQVATVKRRLDNYNETLKKRNRQPIRDPDDDSADGCPAPLSHHVESLPSRYHTTTKTIRRNTATARPTLHPFIPEHTHAATHTPSPLHTPLPPISQGKQADWLLRDCPYSECVAEHKQGGACWDCLHFHGNNSNDLPLGFISHIELSTFLLVLGVQTKRTRPPRYRSRDSGVFGVPLNLLLENDKKKFPGIKVPVVFQKALLVFLRKVVSHQDQNRMSLWNVSMVVAPNLFACRHRGNKHSLAKQQEEMEEAVGGAHLVRLMITHQDLLWIVPTFLLSQVRKMNQASSQKQWALIKTKRQLLRRKNDKNERNQVTELCEGVIRVHAPLHTKISMAIQLEGQTRAKDVIARFECENSPVQHLYEVGGNICERRLHPDCILLDVYRVNPHCDWLIKP